MRVKIKDKIYDANEEPIMLIFDSDKERIRIAEQIRNMIYGATKYCIFPSTEEWTKNNYANIHKFMKIKIESLY